MTVLALPLVRTTPASWRSIAFLGGLSAATAMVIVESVALAIMISNDLVMPIVLRRRALSRRPASGRHRAASCSACAASSILAVLLLGYVYYRFAGEAALASIGLLVLRRHRADRAGLLRRPVLAARQRARRDGRPRRRPRRLGLHAAAAEPGRDGVFWSDVIGIGPVRLRRARADGPVRLRPAAAHPRRRRGASALNIRAFVAFSLARPATAHRAAAGQCLRRRADDAVHGAELPRSGAAASRSTNCARPSRAISARSAPTRSFEAFAP